MDRQRERASPTEVDQDFTVGASAPSNSELQRTGCARR